MLCALILALALHRPGLLSFGKAIPGSAMGDTLRAHWSAWVMAAELPAWPFSTEFAAFPGGVQLIPLPPISLGLIAPITWIAGATMGLVALLILHTMLSVLAGSFLARSLGAHQGPSLAAGLLLATTPILGESLRAGIYEYQTIGWMALMIGALVHACRGSWKWGIAAGALYIITLLECGYYGSAAALAAPVLVLALVRSRDGAIAIGASAATVGIGAGLSYWCFSPVLNRLQSHLQSTPEAGAGLLSASELFAALPFLGWKDPYNGIEQPFYASPSLMLWVGAIAGLFFALRKTWWLGLLALLFLLLAMGSPAMSWWSASELGRHVGMPKRYVAPLALPLCGLAAVGLSHALERWKDGKHSLRAGLGTGIFAAIISANANGMWADYPLLWTPEEPTFLETLRGMPDGAVLVIPQEQPEDPSNRRTFQPMLSDDASFANPQARLWLQTRINRPMRHFSRLGTLIPISESQLRLDDLPRGNAAQFFEPTEIEQLQAQGLSAILIDHGQLEPGLGAQLSEQLEDLGASCQYFEDWSGVSLCTFQISPEA